ncbi:uncharacterized protein LTR77_009379 [Saxophila tyrrhenica]|uniref:N-acetylgalactosaminide beta-1,3-galactosyltransferase n=1 Tax=Saxophila tyrrhenica TaxID=1690608 RepID=A0AAV9NZ96_9PEZI|nr:hypothetical protein LTR77_009379 [Saxophila tyrrhenica]
MPRSALPLLQRPSVIATSFLTFFAVSFLLFTPASPLGRVHNWLHSKEKEHLEAKSQEYDIVLPTPLLEVSGTFGWQTTSSFNPVRFEDVTNKSISELCASWPANLLSDIQPVLKTGHGDVSACLVNLLIFSDTEEHYEGHNIIDFIQDIPSHVRDGERRLEAWRNGSLADGTATRKQAWKTDKFKFLAGVCRAWKMRPVRKWYVFYEADTYIVWDNIFRLLENFDPDEPHYFGAPSKGRRGTWFAYGGSGYVISREAMRRLMREDYDDKGQYLSSKLSEHHWYNIQHDCCGDSILG